jgi:hypothetical protein
MIKFKGKPWEMRGFMQYVIFTYGAKTTIKEFTQIWEARNNASM